MYIMHFVVVRKRSRKHKSNSRKSQQPHICRRCRCIELLVFVFESTKKEASSKNEEQVGKDTSQHGGLYDTNFISQQCLNGYHNFDGIAKCSIDQSTNRLSKSKRASCVEMTNPARYSTTSFFYSPHWYARRLLR